ncbi:SAM-dependent methyltransferase [Actinacidiphila acididurans]|uniref:SAM-dependent methyltransferase n=1 Tax=Actinacidiphila acididurans TaxID=2784346 RepID=A0ABS2U2T3_9ACTN|nr:SAM-dependent methyltransferase [Actinacidiphila acididurans]MBM9509905.1 SAM-dependent methyltransferase [Actinacidiphila acididurans]
MTNGKTPLTDRIDVTVPSVARMYDYLLDGKDNYPADREATEQLLQAVPSMKVLALNNRQFLRRVVRVLAEDYGVKQFVDHGSGLPTQDNVHEVAQRVHPDARVVYTDNDPIVLAHGRALLEQNENTAVLQADFRDTETIWNSAEVRRLINPDEPVAALFVSVLHCIKDSDDPAGVIRRVAERLAPGSFLVVCQLVSEDAETRRFVTDFMDRSTGGNWGEVRQEADVRRFLEGTEILEPGLVEVSTWRQDSDLTLTQPSFEWIEYGGVGRLV